MNRVLKTLGVAMVAALALSVTAGAAQAIEITSESGYPLNAHGENGSGNEVFTTEAGDVECDSTFTSEVAKDGSEITATPTYTNCEAFGFVSATVNMESCDYGFDLESEPESHVYTSKADIECEGEDSIKITAATCAAEVGPQSGKSHVLFEWTTDTDVHAWATVEDIDYTVTKDGFLCPFSGTGEKEGAEYNSEAPVTLTSEGDFTIDE